METEIANPKALNLVGLETATNKVILGAKVNPQLKLTLAHEAERLGISLSEMVENSLANRNNSSNRNINLENLQNEIQALKSKIAFYENDFIRELFRLYRGKPVEYLNESSERIKLTINKVSDVFTIIINSFQIEKKYD